MNIISIEEFAGGAVQEQFNDALMSVMSNMQDPNTPYKNTREINIKIKFAQNENRDKVMCNVETNTKLAHTNPVISMMDVGRDLATGEIFVQEYGKSYPGQQRFDPSTGEILEEHVPSAKYMISDSDTKSEKFIQIL